MAYDAHTLTVTDRLTVGITEDGQVVIDDFDGTEDECIIVAAHDVDKLCDCLKRAKWFAERVDMKH